MKAVMAPQTARIYRFGDFRLNAGKRLLSGPDGKPVSLTPKAYDTLAFLVERAGSVINKDELMAAIWPDTAVEENNLTQNVSLLRRVLGEGRGEHRYIATVPGRGYQFVAGVKVGGAMPASSEPAAAASIAVLPFVNMSGDPDVEYFGDGLAEELIDAFSKLGPMRVVARTSAFSFRGRQADVREIADRLGANLVLEGSVRKSGNRLRIIARLVDAVDGYQLWSECYDRDVGGGGIFEIQDQITPAVVDALKLKLPGGEKASVRRPTENIKARELYLKGRFHSFRMTRSGIETGVPYFEEAVELDPSYALGQVGLAHAYRMFGLSLDMPTNEVGPKATAAARKAVEMDESLAEAHAVLGFSLFIYEWAWSAAEKHAKRALELNPNSADSLWMYAHLFSNLGRHEEALALAARAREVDPLSGLINAMEGQFLLHAGRTEEAIARLREAIEIDPKSRVGHMFLASAYIETCRFSEAIAEAGAASALSLATQQIAYESYANAKLGKRADARNALTKLLELSTKRYVPPYNIALTYMGLGEGSEALTWLDRAFEERDPRMVFLKVEPKWKSLHDNGRYVRLLNRMNLLS